LHAEMVQTETTMFLRLMKHYRFNKVLYNKYGGVILEYVCYGLNIIKDSLELYEAPGLSLFSDWSKITNELAFQVAKLQSGSIGLYIFCICFFGLSHCFVYF